MALTLLGALAAAVIAAHRWGVEQSNRTVELTVEWPELKQLSAVLRAPMPVLLQRFRAAGLNSVALQEQTVRELVDDGEVFRPDPFTDTRVAQLIAGGADAAVRRTVLAFPDAQMQARVERSLAVRWGGDRIREVSLGSMPALLIDGEYAQFRDLGVGIDPVARQDLAAARLGTVARTRNYPALSVVQLQAIINNLKDGGAHAVIFTGDDVIGNPNLIHDTAADLQRAGLAYGSVEFGKQHGDEKLSKALDGEFLRVHTIQGAELSNMTPDAAVARFVKAVRERNIRLCYIHLLSSVTGGTMEGDEDFVRRIAQGLEAAHYEPGIARPMRAWQAPRALLSVVALGLVGAIGWLLLLLWPDLAGSVYVALFVLLAGLVALFPRTMALQGAALVATLVFPTLSMLNLRLPTADCGAPVAARGHQDAAALALTRFLGACLFSLLGALYVIGFLGSTLFMTKTEQFVGIKPSIIVPVLVVALLYWGCFPEPAPFRERWRRFTGKVVATFHQPLQIGHVVLFLIVVVVLGLLVARSGNDSAVGASTFELKTRRILDGLLIARPRTKEVLLGHPALYLALYAAARNWRKWTLPLLAIGAIGQTSLVNTFCHIHTPLFISIFHVLNGLWLGLLLGWILAIGADRFVLREERAAPRANGRRGPAPDLTPDLSPGLRQTAMRDAAREREPLS